MACLTSRGRRAEVERHSTQSRAATRAAIWLAFVIGREGNRDDKSFTESGDDTLDLVIPERHDFIKPLNLCIYSLTESGKNNTIGMCS